MSIKIKKDGQVREFILPATNIQVLDMDNKFKKKDLENVLREVSDTEHIHVGEVDETKDGIWIDDGEILDNAEDNGVVERIKTYVDGEIDSKLREKVSGANRIITNSNLSVLGLTFPVTCETLANAMRNGDVLFCDSYIISDAPTEFGHLFVMRDGENRIEFQFRSCGQDANKKTLNELYIGSYRKLSANKKWSGWLLVASDSGWIDLPLAEGTTNGRRLQFRNLNGRIQMRGSFQQLASSKIIGTLPVGFRPTYRSYFPVCVNSDLYNTIAIETNGTISSFRPASDIGNYTVDLDVISFLNT